MSAQDGFGLVRSKVWVVWLKVFSQGVNPSNICIRDYIRDHFGATIATAAVSKHIIAGRQRLWSRMGDLGMIVCARVDRCSFKRNSGESIHAA